MRAAGETMRSLRAQTWLILRNDLRLLWREMRSGKRRLFSGIAVLGILALILQAITLFIFLMLKQPPPLIAQTVAWWFIGFIMLAASINNAVTVLFERADFDLLLASPVSPRAILLARVAGMAAGAALTVAIFVVPLFNGLLIGVSWTYAAAYLVWLLLGLLVSSVGVWMTLLLVRWLGPRRARTWAQVIAAVLGAMIYIGFQVQNSLGPDLRAQIAAVSSAVFSHPAATFVARAAQGEGTSLLALLALTALATLATTRVLSRIFVSGIQQSTEVRTRARKHRLYRFRDGLLHATFRKDVRLILRDPVLLSRVLPSVLYLAPVLFPLTRIGALGAPGVLAPFGVVLAVMLSSQLTTVAAAGEEGWDLIRLSPASTITLRFAKMAAGMAMPLSLSFAVAIAIALLGRPGLAAFAFSCAVLSTVGSCWLEVASIRPTPRKDLIQRSGRYRRKFSPVRLVAGLMFFGLGALAPALAAGGQWLFAIVAFGIVILGVIACFTLVEMEDIEFEAAPGSPQHERSAV